MNSFAEVTMGNGRCAIVLFMAILVASTVSAFAGESAKGQQPPAKELPQIPVQPQTPAAATDTAPAGSQDDVRSMDNLIAALYQVISGPAGQRRNWDRFRSLFLPGAKLIAISHTPAGELTARQLTVEEYVTRATPFFECAGFYEREIARQVDAFDHLNHVFSTYESRHAPSAEAFERGINSIQLFNDGQRWWLVNIFWEAETPGHAIPQKYLPYTAAQ
jgi:hypothetical protein